MAPRTQPMTDFSLKTWKQRLTRQFNELTNLNAEGERYKEPWTFPTNKLELVKYILSNKALLQNLITRTKEKEESLMSDYCSCVTANQHNMDKHQKRSLLNLIREGILTDESFINITDSSTPERVQVPIPRIVEAMKTGERKMLSMHNNKPLTLRIFYAKHYSSASFEEPT
ncbi:hypothetical protein COOONC_06023 [Cooperia oncophora]